MIRTDFVKDFEAFLKGNGVEFKKLGNACLFVVHTGLLIVPVALENACSMDSESRAAVVSECGNELSLWKIRDVFFLYEDAFRRGEEQWRKRVLARCGIFESVFARKCRVVSLQSQKEKEMARAFLEENHSLGWCSCKACYGLVLAKDKMQGVETIDVEKYEYGDEVIVAVASFSSVLAVKRYLGKDLFVDVGPDSELQCDGIPFESYQWLRYASLAGVRVVGGMGRLLKAFIRDVRAALKHGCETASCGIEIMSYSDNEWSCGNVYCELGFSEYGGRGAVEFHIERSSWRRLRKLPLNEAGSSAAASCELPAVRNCGSKRYLLQLI